MSNTPYSKTAEMMPYKLFDNGGMSFDRFTLITRGAAFGLSENALSPQGFNQFLCDEDELVEDKHLGIRIELEDLPLEVYQAVMNRIQED